MDILNLVSYNILNGIYSSEIINNILGLKDRADIFCLQEVRKLPNREFIGDLIQRALGQDWKSHFLLDLKDPINGLGLAVFWKNHIGNVKIEDLSLPKAEKYSLIESLVTPGGRPSQRGAILMKITSPDHETILIINTHLDWQGGGPNARFERIKLLSGKIEQPSDHVIICGDFNTVENKKCLGNSYSGLRQAIGKDFKEAFPDGVCTHQNGTVEDPTYPLLCFAQKTLKFFGIVLKDKLDYIWYRNLVLVDSKVYELPGSDHFPLFASFSL